jgi:hypothetical protein
MSPSSPLQTLRQSGHLTSERDARLDQTIFEWSNGREQVRGFPMATTAFDFSRERIESLCRKWKVRELSLFGSVLRDDFEAGDCPHSGTHQAACMPAQTGAD